MIEFNTLLNVVSTELTRSITGRLFTDDQIRAVTSNVVGKYFADWLPKVGADKAAHDRVEEARSHIEMASSIITAMQGELNAQTGQLDKLLVEIEGKKKLAERYAELAATNQKQISAIQGEIQEGLRKELTAQSEKGKTIRRGVSAAGWLVTLVLGAWLGTYFKEVSTWIMAHVR